MPLYAISGRTTLVTATANAPLAMLIRAASNTLVRVTEIGITLGTAVASTVGIARSTTATTTPTSLGTPRPLNSHDLASTVIAAVAWTTVGVAEAVPHVRRLTLPATVGAGIIWQFPGDGLIVDGGTAASADLFLVNEVAVTPGVFDFYVNFQQ